MSKVWWRGLKGFTAAAVICGVSFGPAFAKTPEETKAFVEKAIAYIKSAGKDKAFKDFSRADGGFVDGELYMFCYAPDGMNLAHGGNPSFVGKNLLGVKNPDGVQVNGVMMR